MQKKHLLITATALLLAACAGEGVGPVDAQKVLASLGGPTVPTVGDALIETAHNAEKQGDYQQAAQLYQQVLQQHPDNKEVVLELADSYRRSGDNDRALSLYDGLLSQDAANLGAKEGKGLALLAKGDFDTPGKLFEEIMKTDANRWKTLNGLGILFTTRNMQPEAQQYFQAALKNHPASATITNNIGLSQALDRKYDISIATLQQASGMAENPLQRKRIDLNLALVYATAGRLDDAHAVAANYYTGAALDNNLGLYAHLAKDDQMAKAYLNMALTDSKVFYERAWDNLKTIDDESTDSPATKKDPTAAKKTAAPASQKTAKKPEVSDDDDDDDDVSDVVNATDDALASKKKAQK